MSKTDESKPKVLWVLFWIFVSMSFIGYTADLVVSIWMLTGH